MAKIVEWNPAEASRLQRRLGQAYLTAGDGGAARKWFDAAARSAGQ